MSFETIKRQAQIEFEHEQYRAAVEAYKVKLRTKRSVWDRLFPWRIVFVRRRDV